MIEISGLHKSFKKNHVLKGLNLNFADSGICAVLGPNGSGKTTLIKCIMGMVIPNEGSIAVNGINIHRKSKYRELISYLPQIARFPENLKVKEILAMVTDLRGTENRAQQLIQHFDLLSFMEIPLRSLSGGTLQKVNLVMALMHDNDMIILDEPTSGLDPVAMQRLRSLIFEERDKGKTILMTTHIMSFAEEMADRVVYILDGRVYFDGEMKELKKKFHQSTLEQAIATLLEQHKISLNGVMQKEPAKEQSL